jgi:polyisoprenoid-binding protein YceI
MTKFQRIVFVLFGFALAIASSAAVPHATGDTYRITTALVTVMCPLTVGGSFEARTNAVAGDLAFADASGAVKGAVEVDLDTLQTGIGLRDRHMKEKYLEIHRSDALTRARLDEIRMERIEGTSIPFQGKLTLHGEQHTISGIADVQVRQRDVGVHVRARFPISLAAFGIQPPRYLGVGVRDEVQVQVQFTAVSTHGV